MGEVQAAIEAATGIPAPEQRLLCGPEELKETEDLAALFEREESVAKVQLLRQEDLVDRLAGVDVVNASDLEFVVNLIFERALAGPRWCETYADMVYALRTKYPEFPPENEGEQGQTFIRLLLNTCQNEWENLLDKQELTQRREKDALSADELTRATKRRRCKMLAMMKFIGSLFLRQLIGWMVIGQVVHDLIGMRDTPPKEHMIECVCELLQITGPTLGTSEDGMKMIQHFGARLVDLQKTKDESGNEVFSESINIQIQDLLDLSRFSSRRRWSRMPRRRKTNSGSMLQCLSALALFNFPHPRICVKAFLCEFGRGGGVLCT